MSGGFNGWDMIAYKSATGKKARNKPFGNAAYNLPYAPERKRSSNYANERESSLEN
jgi:hypothetical protein